MAMAWIWTGMVTVSLVFAAVNGTMDAVSAAALEGAGAAVELCIAMAGVLCLWSGGRRPGRLRVPDSLRHPAGGVAVVGHLRDGGTADGPAAEPGMEELTWTPRHS